MTYPDDLRYSKDHEWVRADGSTATIGITSFAADELGDIVFVELPDVGRKLDAMKPFGVVEAVKTVSDLYAPLAGEVTAVNEALAENPGLVNQAPYGEGWMIRLKPEHADDMKKLMGHDDYAQLIEQEQA